MSLPTFIRLGLVLGVAIPAVLPAPADELAPHLKLALAAATATGTITHTAPAIPSTDPRAADLAARLRSARQGLMTPSTIPNPLQRSRQAQAVLRTTSDPTLELYLRDNLTVRHLQADALTASANPGISRSLAADPRERAARDFFFTHRALLRLEDPEAELRLERMESDAAGRIHLRFSQRYQDIPVWPSGLIAHFDAASRLSALDGEYSPTPLGLDVAPRITAQEAQERARARVPGGWAATNTTPELILFAPLNTIPRLAWKLDVHVGVSQAWRMVVDAASGRLLHRSSRIFDATVDGSGVDLTGVNRPLKVWQQGASFYLLDTSKPMFQPGFNPVQNPRGVISVADARGTPVDQLGDNNVFNITSTSANTWSPAAGVSALFNFSQTYDYYLERHSRNSLDNQGGNITAIVRVGNYDNASWHGNLSLMLFGDVRPFAASLDVVAHELSHGVTERSAALIYELQSGALNESFSDIFGEMVEARTRGQNDWLVGSELQKPLRNFKNPGSILIGGLNRPFPSKMSEFIPLPNTDDADHGGVHLNSSIINHCFYLLAAGLPEAIGLRDSERIFYLTLTQHLQAQSQFIDCRLGAIASAEALFGKNSAQAQATAKAFDSVEIFAAPTTPEPTPVPVVQGPDSTLFIYQDPIQLSFGLGRRESALGDANLGTVFSEGVSRRSPAVTGDGSLVLYVSEDHDLCIAETDQPSSTVCLGSPGTVHSVAISPDGQLAAFVLRDAFTGDPDGRITVINLETEKDQTYTLVAPAVDGVAVDQVLYADAMAFSTDSQDLLYDALSRVRFSGGNTVERWSLFGLNLGTGRTEIVVPPLDGIDTGNPSPGRAGTRYLTFDAQVETTGNSGIVVLDLFTGQAEVVAVVEGTMGFPCFTGDESGVVYAAPDDSVLGSGSSLFLQKLSTNRLEAMGTASAWMEDAAMGVIYRRGAFAGTNALPRVSLATGSTSATAPANFTLRATASDSDGSVQRVEFYDGSTKLGESTQPNQGAFQLNWNGVGVGQYRLVARAVDNLGGSSDSEAVVLTVSSAVVEATIRAAVLQNGQIRLTVNGPPGNYVIQRSENLTHWNSVLPVTVGASGGTDVTDSGIPSNVQRLFYRVR